jgi:nucleoid-associated protein YgaU
MKAGVTGSLLDALAMEVKVVFSPTPNVVQAIKNKPSVQIGDPRVVGSRRTYTVQSGDWLSKIAQSRYSDKREPAFLWPIIYDANRGVIGGNPNVIKPGQKLMIPDISSYSEAQLDQVRQRGRNWR